MSRRLVNRSGASASSAAAAPSGALPEYQPPSCPLTDGARRALNELSNNRGSVAYQMHLKESTRLLGASVGDLHERLREQRDRLQHQRDRREDKGGDKTHDEERLEAHVGGFGARVDTLTDRSEEAVRDLIDRRAALEDETAVLRDLYTMATAANAAATASTTRSGRRKRTRANDDEDNGEDEEDEDEDEEEDVKPLPAAAPSILEQFNEQRAQKHADYAAMPMHQRYALNNDYAAFKKLWHDSMAGEDGPPLPDPSRWFRPDGQPVMRGPADRGAAGGGGGSGGGLGDGDDDDEDDDIAVAREVLSINCPLTLVPMQEPYSNRKCKHTFEKSAILNYLGTRGDHQCPQTGCSQTFSRTKFDQDFYFDQAMARRIKRTLQAQEQREREEEDEDDLDDDAGDDEVAVRGHKQVPRRPMKTEK